VSLKGETAPGSKNGETPSSLINAKPGTTFLCKEELSFVLLHSKAEYFLRILRTKNNPPPGHFLRHRFQHKSSFRAWCELVSQEGRIHEKRKQQTKNKSIALLLQHQTPAFASHRDQQITV